MGLKAPLKNLEKLAASIEPMLRAARIPGAAIAIVADGKTVCVKGFGYRDLKAKKLVTPNTAYPIASTTKAMNATLLGMLVDEGRIEWDAPVQQYLPQFHLQDTIISSRVTVRDLLTMRTGLPRHDWIWVGSPISRSELVASLAHLEASADFRRRFQYSNLSVTVAGYIAEVVTGKSWEALAREKIFRPLGMRRTYCARPAHGNVTVSYHESARRQLLPSRRLAAEVTAPSGGVVYSTVADMACWVAFNLNGGRVQRHRLIHSGTLAEVHAPQVIIGDRSLTSIPPDAAYALGWAVRPYNGHKCIWHGGYLHDVNSSVMLFPNDGIGLVSFINFGCPALADLLNQHAFDLVMGLQPVQTVKQKLAEYETKIATTRRRNAAVERAPNTRPSHPLRAYLGSYAHAGYGEIQIQRRGERLLLRRYDLLLPLKHWHYDVWVAEDSDSWPIHQPQAFDRACPIQFQANAIGKIASLSIPLEPEVTSIRFRKQE